MTDEPFSLKDHIKSILKDEVVTVRFTKNDGTERTMRCTLIEQFLPASFQTGFVPKKAENPDVIAVWDLDAKGWRSFRVDTIISFDTE